MNKLIVLMFSVVLITGCSESEETVKPSNNKAITVGSAQVDDGCGEEGGEPCQTENCFKCNLKIGNNLTAINADTPYSIPTNIQETKKTGKVKRTERVSRTRAKKTAKFGQIENVNQAETNNTEKVKNTYINSRYGKIAKEAKKKATKAVKTKQKRLEAMSKIVREIQPSESK